MLILLSHWGRVMHICVSKLDIIVSDNGLSPGWRQAIIWTNDGILLIGPLGTNFSEILIEIYTFSFKKIDWKMSSGKCRPFCLGLNVLFKILSCVLANKDMLVMCKTPWQPKLANVLHLKKNTINIKCPGRMSKFQVPKRKLNFRNADRNYLSSSR